MEVKTENNLINIQWIIPFVFGVFLIWIPEDKYCEFSKKYSIFKLCPSKEYLTGFGIILILMSAYLFYLNKKII